MTLHKYFDVNGSTPLDARVGQTWVRFAHELWGNASAHHPEGARARATIEAARLEIARGIGADPEEIALTSGGTESNNWALAGAALSSVPSRRHLLVSPIEHKSVLRAASALAARGVQVELLPVDGSGAVRVRDVERALRPETFAVALMLANNETGVLQPVADVAQICRARGVVLHCDAVAAIGKIPVDVRELGCDLLSLSGHKLYAPKGIGVLYVRRDRDWSVPAAAASCSGQEADFPPLIHGCGQERGLRSGTENTACIAALGTAFERLAGGELHNPGLAELRERLWAGLLELDPGCQRNGTGTCLPNTLSVAFPARSGAELQAALGERGFSVAAGAASSNGEPSHVLIAMGLGAKRARSTLRFSLGTFHDRSSVDDLLDALREILQPRSVPEPAA